MRTSLISSLSGVAQVAVNTVLMVFLVPTFIGVLGMETYGTFALITAVGSLGTFTNFGFSTSLLKYLVEQKDRRSSNDDIWVTLLVIGSATVVVAAVLLFWEGFVLEQFLRVTVRSDRGPIHAFYVACVLGGAAQVLWQVPSAILDSRQKVYLTNGVQLVVGSAGKLLLIGSLLWAPSLETVGWIMLGTSIATLIALSVLARFVWGSLACPGLSSRFGSVVRKHYRYGRTIYASSVMYFFYEPATKLLIGRYIGLAEVGFFDIAVRIKGMIWSVMERLLYPVLPMLANKTTEAESRQVIEEVQHKLLMIVLPLIVSTVFLGQPILAIWLGERIPLVEWGTILIVVSYLLALAFVPLYQFLMVRGHPEKTFLLQSLNVGVNVLLFVLLVPSMGYLGAVIAFCGAVLTTTVVCGWFQWSILGSVLFARRGSAVQLLKLGVVLLSLNGAVAFLALSDIPRLLLHLIVNTFATLLYVRRQGMIQSADIDRYIGRQSRYARLVERLLIQETT